MILCALLPTLLLLAACTPLPFAKTTNSLPAVQQAPKARLTYVAIGASDTYGAGTDDPQTESWPSDLADLLGKNVHLVNLGIPGIHAHEALTVELPVALDSHPNLVTVWLAVNDLADQVPIDQYSRDLDTLLTRLQTGAPHARVAVANVPDLTLLPHFQSVDPVELHARIDAYNSVIGTVVARHHVILIDVHQSWSQLAEHPEYISADGFHPNALGYTQLALLVFHVLRQNGL